MLLLAVSCFLAGAWCGVVAWSLLLVICVRREVWYEQHRRCAGEGHQSDY